jgi:hypothetical protein
MVTLVPSAFRLLRYGAYPPKVGTICSINDDRAFPLTSGFMPELGTYPGRHVLQPFEVRCLGPEGSSAAAQDVLNLTRMNWNTADLRGKRPVKAANGLLPENGRRSGMASTSQMIAFRTSSQRPLLAHSGHLKGPR